MAKLTKFVNCHIKKTKSQIKFVNFWSISDHDRGNGNPF
jgi:hypothetical protein